MSTPIPPRLRFKTKVKNEARDKPAFCSKFGKGGVELVMPQNVELRCRLQGVCLGVCFNSLEMTFKEI